MKWKKFIETYWDASGLFAWGWIFFHLLMIEASGVVRICEDNLVILRIEIAIALIAIAFGVRRFTRDIKQKGG